MKLSGLFLLIAGWLIVVAALLLLPSNAAREGFATAGIAVQILGLVLQAIAHRKIDPERG
jgi:hypothetical protein